MILRGIEKKPNQAIEPQFEDQKNVTEMEDIMI